MDDRYHGTPRTDSSKGRGGREDLIVCGRTQESEQKKEQR